MIIGWLGCVLPYKAGCCEYTACCTAGRATGCGCMGAAGRMGAGRCWAACGCGGAGLVLALAILASMFDSTGTGSALESFHVVASFVSLLRSSGSLSAGSQTKPNHCSEGQETASGAPIQATGDKHAMAAKPTAEILGATRSLNAAAALSLIIMSTRYSTSRRYLAWHCEQEKNPDYLPIFVPNAAVSCTLPGFAALTHCVQVLLDGLHCVGEEARLAKRQLLQKLQGIQVVRRQLLELLPIQRCKHSGHLDVC